MTDTGALRIGVIGVGHVGQHHARILTGVPGVELTAVADIDASRAVQIGAEMGARAETNATRLLGVVDAVTIAVPTEAHQSVALPFLNAGVPVLVEKPIARSLSQADTMIEAAHIGRTILGVGHSERHNPAVTTALALVTAPRFVEVHRLAAFPARGLDVDVVFDLMIHDIDVVLAAVDADPVSIEAVGVPVLTDRVDIANARVRFASGCIANLTASRISRDRVRKLRFFQHHAYVSVDCAAQQVEAYHVRRDADAEVAIEGGVVTVPEGEPLELELRDFVNAVRMGTAPTVDGVAGRRALALAERIAEAMDVNDSVAGA